MNIYYGGNPSMDIESIALRLFLNETIDIKDVYTVLGA